MKACTFILSMAFLFGQTLMAGQPESIRWGYESSLFFLNGNGEYSDESPGQSILGDQVTYRDYHSNGGDERRLWVFPDGTAHAIYFARTKSNDNNTNCTYYVYSKDFGESFTNPKRVESISTHFPSLAVTPNGRAVIASHTFVGNKIKVHIAVDTGAGAGDFQEFIPPDNPQDYGCPFVRAPLDSHIIFWAKSHINLEPRWNAFNPKDGTFLFDEHQIAFSGLDNQYYSMACALAHTSQKVTMTQLDPFYYGTVPNEALQIGILLRESTDGGFTFSEPYKIYTQLLDTTQVYPDFGFGLSCIYAQDQLHVVWTELAIEGPYIENIYFKHWAESVNQGVPTVAAFYDTLLFKSFSQNVNTGSQHFPIEHPHVGVDSNGILTIVFTGFSADAENNDQTGITNADIWAVSSADNGQSWGAPVNLTQTPAIDERFPYISEWNEAGKINVLFQSDPVAGSWYDTNPPVIVPVDIRFLKTDHPQITAVTPPVEEISMPKAVINDFTLEPNYPNPFNPATSITFSLPTRQFVRLEVLNIRGQTVAVLTSDDLAAGSHTYIWRANDHPSGIYCYRLTTDRFSQTRRMVLLR